MSEFTDGGFPSYPNLHLDRQSVRTIAEWPDSRLNFKIAEYREFSRRERILPHHRERATDIQRHLEFEGDYRDGVFTFLGEIAAMDINKLEDEIPCEN